MVSLRGSYIFVKRTHGSVYVELPNLVAQIYRLEQLENPAVNEHAFLEDHNMDTIKFEEIDVLTIPRPLLEAIEIHTLEIFLQKRGRSTTQTMRFHLHQTKTVREVSLKPCPRFHLDITDNYLLEPIFPFWTIKQ